MPGQTPSLLFWVCGWVVRYGSGPSLGRSLGNRSGRTIHNSRIVEDQSAALIERPSFITNVLLDALDLICNLPGIVLFNLLLNFPANDVSHYLLRLFRPSDVLAGDTIFSATLSFAPRCAWAGFYTVCGSVTVYTIVEVIDHTRDPHRQYLLRTTRLAMGSDHPPPMGVNFDSGGALLGDLELVWLGNPRCVYAHVLVDDRNDNRRQ